MNRLIENIIGRLIINENAPLEAEKKSETKKIRSETEIKI